jgi:formate hydrogenlyase transcriptional activator
VTPKIFDTAATLQLAMEASPTALLVTDIEGTIQLVNVELERHFGYARGELAGQPIDVLVPEVLRSIRVAHRDRAHTSNVGGDREVFGMRKDGSLVAVDIELTSIHTADGDFVLASFIGIGGRRRNQDSPPAATEGRREFERFVADLSFQFISLHGDEVVDAIGHGLGRIGDELNLDRCAFVRIGADGAPFDAVTWAAPGAPPIELPLLDSDRFPWLKARILEGDLVAFSALSDMPAASDRTAFAATGTRSAVFSPLSVDKRVAGAVGFTTVHERTWSPETMQRLTICGGMFSQILARQLRDEALRATSLEVERLKDQLEAENVYLRREERERLGLSGVVGQSAALRRVMDQIRQVAPTDSTVLLLGETGTGKELFATQIHQLSARHGSTMVRVNCGAIPATLIESELFGRERGAFTGALSRQVGRFELADHSTIFLDEVGDLPPEVQVKLLRVLEERQIERLGSSRPIAIDTRIIAATHRNLQQRIMEGAFREDLYYRLNVFPIHVPPLRERVEDISLLIWRFVEEFSNASGKRIDAIDKDSLAALQEYAWPGNVRELRNVVERAMISASTRRLTIPLPTSATVATKRGSRLLDVEKEHIQTVLEGAGWRIRGASGAAERLGLKPTTLETRMAKLGLKRPRHS